MKVILEPMGMGKVGKAMSSKSENDDDDNEEDGVSDEEIMAMKAFERASSPEAKYVAFKHLVELCGGY